MDLVEAQAAQVGGEGVGDVGAGARGHGRRVDEHERAAAQVGDAGGRALDVVGGPQRHAGRGEQAGQLGAAVLGAQGDDRDGQAPGGGVGGGQPRDDGGLARPAGADDGDRARAAQRGDGEAARQGAGDERAQRAGGPRPRRRAGRGPRPRRRAAAAKASLRPARCRVAEDALHLGMLGGARRDGREQVRRRGERARDGRLGDEGVSRGDGGRRRHADRHDLRARVARRAGRRPRRRRRAGAGAPGARRHPSGGRPARLLGGRQRGGEAGGRGPAGQARRHLDRAPAPARARSGRRRRGPTSPGRRRTARAASTGQGLDLDHGLLEEAGDAALEALAAADDDGVGAELVAHLRERVGQAAGAEGLGGSGAHADTTPMVSTLMPGAISL